MLFNLKASEQQPGAAGNAGKATAAAAALPLHQRNKLNGSGGVMSHDRLCH